MSTLVANAMLWRTAPAATELEQVTVQWLRQGLGLSDRWTGLFTDTASTSSLIALAAARERTSRDLGGDGAAAAGLAGSPPLRIYASEEAHSSIEKAAMTLGIGRAGVRRIPTDDDYAMDVPTLRAAIEEDRSDGFTPGRRSSRPSARPARPPSTRSRRSPTRRIGQRFWLHVDAAYAGPPRCCRSVATRSPAGSVPIRSSSTRTSGSSRPSTARCC